VREEFVLGTLLQPILIQQCHPWLGLEVLGFKASRVLCFDERLAPRKYRKYSNKNSFCFNSKVVIFIGTLVLSYFRPKKLDNSQSEIYSTTPISHLLFWICTCPPDFFFILSDLTSNFQDVKEKMLFF